MKYMVTLVAVLGLVLAVMPSARGEDTVESVKAEASKQWETLKSISGKFAGNADVKLNPNAPNPLKLLVGGSIDRDGTKFHATAWAGMTETARLFSANSVCDGKEIHTDTLVFGQRNSDVTPFTPDMANLGPKDLFAELDKHVNLKLAPGEKVGERDCWVLDATAKEENPSVPVGRIRLFVAKDCGMPVKINVFDKADASMGEVKMTELKLNQPVPAEAFVYTPPAPPSGTPAPATPAPATPAPAAAAK